MLTSGCSATEGDVIEVLLFSGCTWAWSLWEEQVEAMLTSGCSATEGDATGSFKSMFVRLSDLLNSADFVLWWTNFFTACLALTGEVVAVICPVVTTGVCITGTSIGGDCEIGACAITLLREVRAEVTCIPPNCTGMLPIQTGGKLWEICPLIVVTGSCEAPWCILVKSEGNLCSRGSIGRWQVMFTACVVGSEAAWFTTVTFPSVITPHVLTEFRGAFGIPAVWTFAMPVVKGRGLCPSFWGIMCLALTPLRLCGLVRYTTGGVAGLIFHNILVVDRDPTQLTTSSIPLRGCCGCNCWLLPHAVNVVTGVWIATDVWIFGGWVGWQNNAWTFCIPVWFISRDFSALCTLAFGFKGTGTVETGFNCDVNWLRFIRFCCTVATCWRLVSILGNPTVCWRVPCIAGLKDNCVVAWLWEVVVIAFTELCDAFGSFVVVKTCIDDSAVLSKGLQPISLLGELDFFSKFFVAVTFTAGIGSRRSPSALSCRRIVGLARKLTSASAAWDSLTFSACPEALLLGDERKLPLLTSDDCDKDFSDSVRCLLGLLNETVDWAFAGDDFFRLSSTVPDWSFLDVEAWSKLFNLSAVSLRSNSAADETVTLLCPGHFFSSQNKWSNTSTFLFTTFPLFLLKLLGCFLLPRTKLFLLPSKEDPLWTSFDLLFLLLVLFCFLISALLSLVPSFVMLLLIEFLTSLTASLLCNCTTSLAEEAADFTLLDFFTPFKHFSWGSSSLLLSSSVSALHFCFALFFSAFLGFDKIWVDDFFFEYSVFTMLSSLLWSKERPVLRFFFTVACPFLPPSLLFAPNLTPFNVLLLDSCFEETVLTFSLLFLGLCNGVFLLAVLPFCAPWRSSAGSVASLLASS